MTTRKTGTTKTATSEAPATKRRGSAFDVRKHFEKANRQPFDALKVSDLVQYHEAAHGAASTVETPEK